jgi:hypothetical protein
MKSYVILFFSVLLLPTSSSSQTNSPAHAWTFVQAGHCVAGGGASSCTIDLDSNLTPGNLYVFLGYLDSDWRTNGIASSSAIGRLVREPGCQGRSQVNVSPTCAYILPSTSGGGTSPITVTFSQRTTARSESWAYLAEFHTNTSGYINLDNTGSFFQPPSTRIVGPPFTASASSDVTCEAIISSGDNFIHFNAVSPPYDLNSYFPGEFLGFSCGASKVVPRWTPASETAAIAMGLSIGLNPSPGKEETFIDFEGGRDGAAPTEVTLRASTHGWQGGHWDTAHVKTMVYATAASHPLQHATGRLLGDGINYAGRTGTLGIKITGRAPTAQSDYIRYDWSSSNLTDMTIGAWYYTDLPAIAGSCNDCLSIHGFNNEFAAINCYGAAGVGRYIALETPAGNGPVIKISSSTWYWIQVHWHFDGTYFTHSVTVRDTIGNLIGTSTYGPYEGPADYPAFSDIGKSNNSPMAKGKIQYLDSIKLSLVGDDSIGQ